MIRGQTDGRSDMKNRFFATRRRILSHSTDKDKRLPYPHLPSQRRIQVHNYSLLHLLMQHPGGRLGHLTPQFMATAFSKTFYLEAVEMGNYGRFSESHKNVFLNA